MLNINREFVLALLCGAFLAAASNASHASNVSGASSSQADQVRVTEPHTGYWSCPAEFRDCQTENLPMTAKLDDQGTRTDATVWDAPEQTPPSVETQIQYYGYGGMIFGD